MLLDTQDTREKKEPQGKLALEDLWVVQECMVQGENKDLGDHRESRAKKVTKVPLVLQGTKEVLDKWENQDVKVHGELPEILVLPDTQATREKKEPLGNLALKDIRGPRESKAKKVTKVSLALQETKEMLDQWENQDIKVHRDPPGNLVLPVAKVFLLSDDSRSGAPGLPVAGDAEEEPRNALVRAPVLHPKTVDETAVDWDKLKNQGLVTRKNAQVMILENSLSR